MIFADAAARVESLPRAAFVLLCLGLVAALGVALFFAIRNFKRRRMIEDTPTSRLRSAPQGFVELSAQGRNMPGLPIKGPLTGRDCLWFEWHIQQRRRSGRDTRWVTVRSGASDALFALEDGTGVCLVDVEGADIRGGAVDRWAGEDPFPHIGPKVGAFLGLGGYRYYERRLMPGPVYALGWLETRQPVEGDMGDEVAVLLRRWKKDQAGLHRRFDQDGDGRIDAEEWGEARRSARSQIQRERGERSPEPPLTLLRRPPESSLPFVLSDRAEVEVSRQYGQSALVASAALVLVLVVLVWLLVARG